MMILLGMAPTSDTYAIMGGVSDAVVVWWGPSDARRLDDRRVLKRLECSSRKVVEAWARFPG
jgi:hypothetical protein